MARELMEYRDNYAALLDFFDDRRLLTAKDVARYTGRHVETVKRTYDISKDGITIPTLARRMCR